MSKNKLKICRLCGLSFPETLEYFEPNGKFPNGTQRMYSRCRTCKKGMKRTNTKKLREDPDKLEEFRKYDREWKKKQRKENSVYAQKQKEYLKKKYHFKKGYCCNNNCKHCPYKKQKKKQNDKS